VTELRGRVVVISPHVDYAVLSARAAKRRALAGHRPQLPLLRGRRRSPPVAWRIGACEARRRGASVLWIERRRDRVASHGRPVGA